jgi:hypothetical protein
MPREMMNSWGIFVAVVLVAILLGLIRAFDWHDATSLRANYWQNPK